MQTFEWIVILLFGAALLSALARRIGVPYPILLALAGIAIPFLPGGPSWELDPHLALTLFVAPVLVDAAFDTSLRDLRDNWFAVTGLVLAAVGVTTLAVAIAARWMEPDMGWAVAIALGAIVAPPDAAAATAIMRQVKVPHRLLKILEGESLLNDASALLIYKLAIMAATAGAVSISQGAPVLLLTVFGSVIVGFLLSRVTLRLMQFRDFPTAIIVQFSTAFGVWILAEELGLSGILTIVVFAMSISNYGGNHQPAALRVPTYAVWEAAVFILNALAFVLIGMQIGPIWETLSPDQRTNYAAFALVVLAVAIVARFASVMTQNTIIRWHIARYGFNPRRPIARPTVKGGLVISWSGMRGIVTLAAAFAIPRAMPDGSPFPHRDLIVFTAFVVVIGTIVLQGLTLGPLIKWLGLTDNDPVGHEVRQARMAGYRAAVASLEADDSLQAKLLRKEYGAIADQCAGDTDTASNEGLPGADLRLRAIAAARAHIFNLRQTQVIGDDAFNVLQEELDWAELSAGGRGVE